MALILYRKWGEKRHTFDPCGAQGQKKKSPFLGLLNFFYLRKSKSHVLLSDLLDVSVTHFDAGDEF